MRKLFLACIIILYSSILLFPETAIYINTENEKATISKNLYGGGIIWNWNSTMRRDIDKLKELDGITWRIWSGVGNTDNGIRWDMQTIETDSSIYTWNKFNVDDGTYSIVKYFNTPNEIKTEFWGPATDLTHSVSFLETSAASNCYINYQSLDIALPVYIRFDLRIDSKINFSVKETNYGWVLARAGKQLFNFSIFKLSIFSNRKLQLICYDTNFKAEGNDPGGSEHRSILSQALDFDKWYSIEIFIGEDDAKLWIDNELVDIVTNNAIGLKITSLQLGSIVLNNQYIFPHPSDITGKIYIDAFRVSETKVGNNIQLPWKDDEYSTSQGYLIASTFDGNLHTVDDFFQMAEECNADVVVQIPLSNPDLYTNKEGAYEWDTLQYWADLIEYINGTADANYMSVNFATNSNGYYLHNDANENWANLRAQRGRVEPYNLKYVEIGNEPYYEENWNNQQQAYAQRWADLAKMIKNFNPDLKIGLPGNKDMWDTIIPAVQNQYPNDDLIDWLAIHTYSDLSYTNIQDTYNWAWWLGGPVAYTWETSSFAGMAWLREIPEAITAIDTYLSDKDVFIGMTEYNDRISYNYNDHDYLGTAILRGSFLTRMIQNSDYVKIAQVWLLETQQKHTYGLLGDGDDSGIGRIITPSFYLYKMMLDYFNNIYVDTYVDNSPITNFYYTTFGDADDYTYSIPDISAVASVNETKDNVSIFVINRNVTSSHTVNVHLIGMDNEQFVGTKYYIAGNSPLDNNRETPGAIYTKNKSIGEVNATFAVTVEPLSLNLFVLEKINRNIPSSMIVVQPKSILRFNETALFSLDFSLPESGDVEINIYTVSGQRVFNLKNNYSAGDNNVQIELKNFVSKSEKVYFYQIKYKDYNYKGILYVVF